MNKNDITNMELPSLIPSNEHSKYKFDVLPDKMISIASASHPDCADLICIALDKENYGGVYYYFDLWYNKGFKCSSYYINKKEEILKKYKLENLSPNVISENAKFELDRVPFVKVADSFSDFLNSLLIKNIGH